MKLLLQSNRLGELEDQDREEEETAVEVAPIDAQSRSKQIRMNASTKDVNAMSIKELEEGLKPYRNFMTQSKTVIALLEDKVSDKFDFKDSVEAQGIIDSLIDNNFKKKSLLNLERN